MLSCHVMSCYVMLSVTTLPLFDTSVTVANMNNRRSDYNKCEYAQNVSIKFSNFQRQLFVINQTPHHLRYFEFTPSQHLWSGGRIVDNSNLCALCRLSNHGLMRDVKLLPFWFTVHSFDYSLR